jgi:hypothetical protein
MLWNILICVQRSFHHLRETKAAATERKTIKACASAVKKLVVSMLYHRFGGNNSFRLPWTQPGLPLNTHNHKSSTPLTRSPSDSSAPLNIIISAAFRSQWLGVFGAFDKIDKRLLRSDSQSRSRISCMCASRTGILRKMKVEMSVCA